MAQKRFFRKWALLLCLALLNTSLNTSVIPAFADCPNAGMLPCHVEASPPCIQHIECPAPPCIQHAECPAPPCMQQPVSYVPPAAHEPHNIGTSTDQTGFLRGAFGPRGGFGPRAGYNCPSHTECETHNEICGRTGINAQAKLNQVAGELASNQSNTSAMTGQNFSVNYGGYMRSLVGHACSAEHHAYENHATALSGSTTANGSLAGSLELPHAFGLNLASHEAVLNANINQSMELTVGGFLGADGNIVGGIKQTITPGQMVTAAQYAALEQIEMTGQQTLVITRCGKAVSGLITLVAGEIGGLTSVHVPTRVVLNTIGFTDTNPLNVTGAAQVNGSLYALQQANNVTSNLQLGSLNVGGRGLITDRLSNQNLFNNIFASNGLTLNILGDLTNQGTINSSGTLSIYSGGEIANLGTANHQAEISASNVNLYSASGNVRNSGQIIANTGNVRLNAALAKDININNINGQIKAQLGSIYVRDAAYTGLLMPI